MMNTLLQTEIDQLLRSAFELYEVGEFQDAIKIYLKAAKFGSGDAMTFLGVIYDDKIEPSDEKKARIWFKKGVKFGDELSAWNLAMHHARKKSHRWYLYWLKIAQTMGHKNAAEEIGSERWWKKLTLHENDDLMTKR